MPPRFASTYSPNLLLKSLLLMLFVGLAACSEAEIEPAEGSVGQGGQPAQRVIVETAETRDVDVRQGYAGRARAPGVEVRLVSRASSRSAYTRRVRWSVRVFLFALIRSPLKPHCRPPRRTPGAEADLRQAEREWNRISSLYERNAVSERDRIRLGLPGAGSGKSGGRRGRRYQPS